MTDRIARIPHQSEVLRELPVKPITIIAARDARGVIGYRGKIPWRLKADMKIFRDTTKRQTVIMGRKTWDSLPIKPLPIRTNIVISNTLKPSPGDYILAKSLRAALLAAQNLPGKIMVVGGTQVYTDAIQFADELLLTEVHADLLVDPDHSDLFPWFDEDRWVEISKFEVAADADNQFDFTHRVLKRK